MPDIRIHWPWGARGDADRYLDGIAATNGNGDAVVRLKTAAVLTNADGSAANPVGTDRSGTIATGGAAQQLCTQPPNGYEVLNPDLTNDLWINDRGGSAAPNTAGSFRVAANGGSYTTPATMKPLANAVSIVGAVTGQAFTARSW